MSGFAGPKRVSRPNSARNTCLESHFLPATIAPWYTFVCIWVVVLFPSIQSFLSAFLSSLFPLFLVFFWGAQARPSPLLSSTDGDPSGPTLNIDEFAQFVFSNQRCAELEKLMIKIRYGSDQRGSGGLSLHLRADQLGKNFRQREKTHLLGQVSGIPSRQLLPSGSRFVMPCSRYSMRCADFACCCDPRPPREDKNPKKT